MKVSTTAFTLVWAFGTLAFAAPAESGNGLAAREPKSAVELASEAVLETEPQVQRRQNEYDDNNISTFAPHEKRQEDETEVAFSQNEKRGDFDDDKEDEFSDVDGW
ncbi:unnamed protein product [Parascedosporium putredinis]|uniref:Uncharacterized protein n=1 Tax=Parascedosporium putredinis TaxID=1442378 RepID=A0A9P1MDB8_9PEZI|nr:unnamed protein product [Parascedosporium putredinis]CAI8003332.1 unnamed protein product [Parascedosporium putredinis]